MIHQARSIRPFIGSKNFDRSRSFYRDLGFEETTLTHNMSVFKTNSIAFYLQDAYVEDWINNTMIFLEVEDIDRHWVQLQALHLPATYKSVKVSAIRNEHWGREYFMHDPSGVLWHFGQFAGV